MIAVPLPITLMSFTQPHCSMQVIRIHHLVPLTQPLLGQHHRISQNRCCVGSTRIQGWVRWDWWGNCDQTWSGTVRGVVVEIGASHQIQWNILREHNWGVPSSSYYVYILCYIYFRVFDHAMGMHTYRPYTYYNCMRKKYYSPHQSESMWSHVWALLGGNNKEK